MERKRVLSLSVDWERMFKDPGSQEKLLMPPLAPNNLPLEERPPTTFTTGSVYIGSWNKLGMCGKGIYRMPNNVIYEGEMKDGMFHGKGVLHYPNEGRVEGVWERGTMVSRKYMFPDRLEYTEDDIFPYLKMPDRRFTREMKHGIKPAGRSELTNDKHPRPIPEGCYDTGFAFYNPKTKCLTLPNTGKIVGVPTKKREEWIKKHCRKAWDENVGFRPDLYECWYDVREGSSSTSEKELVEQAFSDKSKVGKTPEEVFTTQVHQTVENMGLDLIGEDSLTEVSSERDIVWLHQEVRTNAKDDVHVDVAQKP